MTTREAHRLAHTHHPLNLDGTRHEILHSEAHALERMEELAWRYNVMLEQINLIAWKVSYWSIEPSNYLLGSNEF